MAGTPITQAQIDAVRAAFVRFGGRVQTTAESLRIDPRTVKRYTRDLVDGSDEPEPETATESLDAMVERLVQAKLAKMAGDVPLPVVEQATPVILEPFGKTRKVIPAQQYERIVFLSDLHHPFMDRPAFSLAMKAIRDYRPQLIILAGDMFDCYSISDHDKEPGRADTLQDEFDEAQPTWAEIDEIGCDVVYFKGNHEERIDRIQRKTPGLFRLRSMEIAIAAEMPKRWLYYPNQTQYQLGPLTCHHGDLKGRGTASVHAAAGMLNKLRRTCIFGHLHRFQSFMQTGSDGTVRAGYANGHLCNVEEAHYITSPDWQSGFSTIDFDWSESIFTVVPHLIVDGKMRWETRTYLA